MADTKQKVVLGKCRFCGGDIIETEKGWGCGNYKGGCKAFIFKDDFFFKQVFAKKVTKVQALKFLKGDSVQLTDVVVKGKKCDVTLTWGTREGGKFGYETDFKFKGAKT